jgi:hypothetical protein
MTNYTNYIKQVNSFDSLISNTLFIDRIQTNKIKTDKIKVRVHTATGIKFIKAIENETFDKTDYIQLVDLPKPNNE